MIVIVEGRSMLNPDDDDSPLTSLGSVDVVSVVLSMLLLRPLKERHVLVRGKALVSTVVDEPGTSLGGMIVVVVEGRAMLNPDDDDNTVTSLGGVDVITAVLGRTSLL